MRDGAVPHMKNMCSSTPLGVKIVPPHLMAETAERIGALGVGIVGDPGLLSTVPQPELPCAEPRIVPEAAPRAPGARRRRRSS